MFQRYIQSQRLQQRADPQMLLTNRILQMSALELRQYLTQELDENPALESLEEQECGNCEIPSLQCADCPFSAFRLRPNGEASTDTPLAAIPEEVDPLARIAAPPTLQEHLLTQFRAVAGPEDLPIGSYLIANINDGGYLQTTVEEAVRQLGVEPEEVERVLRLVQGLDPSGVGARSLQECLLIQARALAGEVATPAFIERVLTEFWSDLAASRLRPVARKLRVSVEELERGVEWLRRNLSPYPGSGYRPNWQKNVNGAAQAVRPDVRVTLNELGELELEVVGEDEPLMCVSPHYAQLWQQMRDNPDAYSTAERKHVQDYLQRARMFLKGIQDRKSILHQVAECVLSEQDRYLRSEREEDMLPITQAQLATFLRVHESTVSRAVAEKYLQLPSGRVVPLSHFFDRSLSHRRLVANVVASENPSSPYSDQEISDILRSKGITIARRTVMKYREEMNILSSRHRARIGA